MSNVPSELHYTQSHEWVRNDSAGLYTVGITQHAQALLGDMVFVELPALEQAVQAGQEVAVVESVKAASDVYSPLSGQVVAVNSALNNAPELVNSDPYGQGWLFQVRCEDEKVLTTLLDADAYSALIESSS